jgi:tetratricopeptide (TPR) repeat protein
MDHPNIAKVLDGGTTSAGRPYFVMDLVKGVPITKYCDEHHLTPRQRLGLFIPVCESVQHAHQRGIIHRDLKPSNVLVALYDGKPAPKVIDFGVAKAAGQPLTEQTLVTGFGAIVGTLEYMSPEQAEVNQLDIDTRSDIYSLGVLLYELLAGSPPFSRKELTQAGVLEMLRVIREEEPTKPSAKLSTEEALPTLAANRGTEPAKLTKLVRGELDWIVMKALEKDRSRRYETAKDFAADVQRYLNDEPVQACPASALYRLRKFARRNQRALATAALLCVMLIVTCVVVIRQAQERLARQAEADRDLAVAEHGLDQAVARATNVRTELHTALGKPGGVQQLLNQPARWEVYLKAMQAELERAKMLAAAADGNLAPELFRRLAQLERELVADESDYRLARRLEQIRMDKDRELMVDGKSVYSQTRREYAIAFEEAGLALLSGRESDVAALVSQSTIKEQLLTALDDWGRLQTTEPELADRVLAVARLADPDPLRDQFRRRGPWQNGQPVVQLPDNPLEDVEFLGRLTPQMLLLIGIALDGKFAKQVAWLRKAQAMHPTDFWISYHLANVLFRGQQSQAAIGYYRVALALRPESSNVYNSLGNALAAELDFRAAVDAYKKALAIGPPLAPVWNNLGNALVQLNDLPTAVDAYQKALAINPQFAAAWNGLGVALRFQKDLDAAVDACKKALLIDPENAMAWSNLGLTYRELARQDKDGGWLPQAAHAFAQVVGQYEKLVAKFPAKAEHHRDLGANLNDLATVLNAQRKVAEARSALERALRCQHAALKLNPSDRRSRTFLAIHYRGLCTVLTTLGEHAETERIATEWAWNFSENAREIYDAAASVARCAPLVDKDGALPKEKRQQLARAYEDRAMELLHQAVKHGWRDVHHMKKNRDLDLLRSRTDFNKLVAELEIRNK